MSRPAAEVLEFPDLLELVAGFATSPLGRRAVVRLAPGRPAEELAQEFALVAELRELLERGEAPSFGGIEDPEPWLRRLEIQNTVLAPEELLAAANLLDAAAVARRQGERLGVPFPGLAAVLRALPQLDLLVAVLRRAIQPPGVVTDEASPRLAELRHRQRRLQEQIRKKLQQMVARLNEAELHYVTLRHGRYVIPLPAARRRQVPGVLHGTSSSGQTLFLEPLEVVEENNELQALAEAEQEEVERILAALTERLRQHAPELARVVAVLERVDGLRARAEFARRFRCTLPALERRGPLCLTQVRHPLLERSLAQRGRAMVPLDLELNSQQRVLVISGPNAGGKTAALKTIGLAVLAAHAGLPVAAEQARIPLVDHVLADIGDEQSLTADLSTFSAHMLRLRQILEQATADSLVLLDELGGATEPAEGAALAIAALERLCRQGPLTLATTHYDRVKAWATTVPGVVNAAMEWDEDTLQPTYRLRMGLPGRSSGLAIARRMGLPAELLARAEQQLDPQMRQVAEGLAALWTLRRKMEEELQQERRQLAQERERLAEQWAAEVQRLRAAWEAQLEPLFQRVRADAEQLLLRIEDQRVRRRTERHLQAALARLQAQARSAWSTIGTAPPSEAPTEQIGAGPPAAEALQPGVWVEVRSLRRPVLIRELRGGHLQVQAGALRLSVPCQEVVRVVPEPRPTAVGSHAGSDQGSDRDVPEQAAADEVNVIGCTVEEACRQVDRVLDRAVRRGASVVRIVHGYGTGRCVAVWPNFSAPTRSSSGCRRQLPSVAAMRSPSCT